MSRRQEGENAFSDAHAMLDFPFPFLARQAVAVCGFPPNRPHTENDTCCNDERGSELLLIYLCTVTRPIPTRSVAAPITMAEGHSAAVAAWFAKGLTTYSARESYGLRPFC
jgi:hypothetical protein